MISSDFWFLRRIQMESTQKSIDMTCNIADWPKKRDKNHFPLSEFLVGANDFVFFHFYLLQGLFDLRSHSHT